MGKVPLPPGLVDGPFTVAESRAAGLRSSDLRGVGLHRPTHGVRTTAAPASLVEQARAFAVGLPPDAAFSHLTALALLGLPLPAARTPPTVLDVMRPSSRVPTRRRGCRGHRGLESREVVVREGVRVVAGPDTWCDLGELLTAPVTPDDLVVVGDAVVAAGAGPDPVRRLRTALEARVRPRGRAALVEALGLVRAPVRSPMETRARLMFVRAGFPEPEINAVVPDRAGGWLLEGNLVWRRERVVGEYQGADHADRRRRSADAHRAGLAADEGWTVLEIFAEDLVPGPRRRTTLHRFARELGLAHGSLRID